MASDPWAVPLLVGLGVDELSVHPPRVAQIKDAVRSLDAATCAQAVARALQLETAQAVRQLLQHEGLHE